MTLNRAALSCLVVAFGGCSLINGGFEECSTDSQCGASRVCLEKYCLPLPPQCRREVGGFDRPDSIRIAALLPLSVGLDGGAVDAAQVARLNAIDLAVEDVNGSSGVNNRLFSLYVCNTARDDALVASQATWATQQLGVPAMITSRTDETTAATDALTRADAGTFIISANATSQELVGLYQRNGTPWRVAPPDGLQVEVMARLLTQLPDYAGSHGYLVLYEKSAYGLGIASPLRERLLARNRNVDIAEYQPAIDVARFSATARDFHAADAGLSRTTVFVGFAPDIVPFVSAAASIPVLSAAAGHRWFFSDSGKNSTIVTPQTVSQLVGALGTTPAQGAGTAYQDFRSRYRTRYQLDPNDFSFTAHSYDAAMLLMLSAAWAARDNGPITGARMNEAMLRLNVPSATVYRLGPTTWRDASAALGQARSINVEGASGALEFNPDAGAPASPYEIWQISDGGTFTTLRTENP